MKINELTEFAKLANIVIANLEKAISEHAIIVIDFPKYFLTFDKAELITSYLDSVHLSEVFMYDFDAYEGKLTIIPMPIEEITKEIHCSIKGSKRSATDINYPAYRYVDATDSGVLH